MKDFEKKASDEYLEACINKGVFYESGLQSLGIPTFVGEWIIDRFSNGESMTDEARAKINSFVKSHLPRKEQKEEIKHRFSQGETITLLDQFRVTIDLKTNTPELEIPSIDEIGSISSTAIDQNPNLLGGGMWGAGKLIYMPPDSDSNWSKGELRLMEFKPLQISKLDLDYYCNARDEFTLPEWRDLILSSMGSNPDVYTPDEKIHLISRLIPIVQPNTNIIELAPKGTGKSFIYQNLSKYVRVVSGGQVTAAALFYNLASNAPGLLTQYDVVVFDEAQSISFNKPGEVIGILKDYLESGRYTRGKQSASADAGLVLLGNIPLDASLQPLVPNLFLNLPNFLQETAFIDRLHGMIPGWEIPRVTKKTPSKYIGFKADFFGEVLHRLRLSTRYEEYVSRKLELTGTDDMRDHKAILKLTSGFLKILFPNMSPSNEEFIEYCVKPSVRMRQKIRDQLSQLDPEYKKIQIFGSVARHDIS